MTHAVLLVVAGSALVVAGSLGRTRRLGWPRGARVAAEWAWIACLTLWLAEVGATWMGLGVPPARQPWRRPEEPVALSIDGVDLPDDWVRPRTDTPLVAFVGDSFTAGQGVLPADALPDQVRAALTARGAAIDDRNLGQPGDSFTWEVDRYAALGSSLDPDVVVWVFVLNDFEIRDVGATDDLITDRRALARSGVRVVDALVQAQRDWRLGAATVAAYHEALAADAQAWSTQGAKLATLVAERRAAGGRFVFVIYPLLHELSRYPFASEHARLAAWARDAGAEVVDLLPTFAGQDAPSLWVSTQDHHPNAQAQRMAAQAVADALATAPVGRARPTRCEALPMNEYVADALRAACDRRDAATSLGLAQAAVIKAPRLARTMAVAAVWRARGAPDEAVVRAEAAQVLATPEGGAGP